MEDKRYFVRMSFFGGPYTIDDAAEISDRVLKLAKKAGLEKATVETEIFESTKNGGKRLVDESITT